MGAGGAHVGGTHKESACMLTFTPMPPKNAHSAPSFPTPFQPPPTQLPVVYGGVPAPAGGAARPRRRRVPRPEDTVGCWLVCFLQMGVCDLWWPWLGHGLSGLVLVFHATEPTLKPAPTDTNRHQPTETPSLESDIATLEQHLGKMRAAYQLNAEKLEYNYRWAAFTFTIHTLVWVGQSQTYRQSVFLFVYSLALQSCPSLFQNNCRVLAERDAENATTIHQQKRKLSQQHDVLAALKAKCVCGVCESALVLRACVFVCMSMFGLCARHQPGLKTVDNVNQRTNPRPVPPKPKRYAAATGRHQEENGKLADEYKRVTEQFKDLQVGGLVDACMP